MALSNRKIGYDEVVARDIHFPMNTDNVARHWFGNDPWTTHWMNAILAAVFKVPPGAPLAIAGFCSLNAEY